MFDHISQTLIFMTKTGEEEEEEEEGNSIEAFSADSWEHSNTGFWHAKNTR